jgi:hypothetical protein
MNDMMPRAPSNVTPHPLSFEGKLTTPDGEQLPVRTFERGKDVVLVVMVDIDGPHDSRRLAPALLEYTSMRGVIRLRGEAVFEDRNVIRFQAEGDADVMQRRAFVRVHVPQPVSLDDDEETIHRQAHTVDLSGGGMLLAGAEVFESGQTVHFSMQLGGQQSPIEGLARVVRATEDGKRALVFEMIDERDRQRLIRFVFACMRTARAKTRGDWL